MLTDSLQYLRYKKRKASITSIVGIVCAGLTACALSQADKLPTPSKTGAISVMNDRPSSQSLTFDWPVPATAQVIERHGSEAASYDVSVINVDGDTLEVSIKNLKVLTSGAAAAGPPPGMVSGFLISKKGEYLGPSPKVRAAMISSAREMGMPPGMDSSLMDAQIKQALAGMSEQFYKPLWNAWVGQWIGIDVPDKGGPRPFPVSNIEYMLPAPSHGKPLHPVSIENDGAIPGSPDRLVFKVRATANAIGLQGPGDSSVPREWSYTIEMEGATMRPYKLIIDSPEQAAPKPYASYEFKWSTDKASE